MVVTQVDIAKELAIDVSTVNKILNNKHGPVFQKKTIDAVLKTAKRMGYRFPSASKYRLMEVLLYLFPLDQTAEYLARRYRLPLDKMKEIVALIERAR